MLAVVMMLAVQIPAMAVDATESATFNLYTKASATATKTILSSNITSTLDNLYTSISDAIKGANASDEVYNYIYTLKSGDEVIAVADYLNLSGAAYGNLPFYGSYSYKDVTEIIAEPKSDYVGGNLLYYVGEIDDLESTDGNDLRYPDFYINKDLVIADQLPSVGQDFYDVEWKVWTAPSGAYASAVSSADLSKNGSAMLTWKNDKGYNCIDSSNYTLFQCLLTPIDYSIPVYTADNTATGKSLDINIDTATTASIPTGIENNGYKFYYNGVDKGSVATGADVWSKIEAIGGTFDDDNAKIVAVAKEVETTTAAKEEETTTVKKEETTTAPTTTAAGETPTTTVDNTSKDVKAGSATRTVIPFVVIAFVAVIGTCVIVTKKKLKEA